MERRKRLALHPFLLPDHMQNDEAEGAWVLEDFLAPLFHIALPISGLFLCEITITFMLCKPHYLGFLLSVAEPKAICYSKALSSRAVHLYDRLSEVGKWADRE